MIPFQPAGNEAFDKVLVLIKDVTGAVKAEEALRKSEKRYRDVIENCGEGIAVLQDDYITFINPKGCEISGYKEADFANRPLIEFIYHEDTEKINRITREVLEQQVSPPPWRLKKSTPAAGRFHPPN
jgi:PAS domain S-box-containing protein